MKQPCKILFIDDHDTPEDVTKEVKEIVEYYGLKTISLDVDFVALAIGTQELTKQDAERELEKHRAKD